MPKLQPLHAQEGDLFKRAVEQPEDAGEPTAKFCLHTGAFVFHYKVVCSGYSRSLTLLANFQLFHCDQSAQAQTASVNCCRVARSTPKWTAPSGRCRQWPALKRPRGKCTRWRRQLQQRRQPCKLLRSQRTISGGSSLPWRDGRRLMWQGDGTLRCFAAVTRKNQDCSTVLRDGPLV